MNLSHFLGATALSLTPLAAYAAGQATPDDALAQPTLQTLLRRIDALQARVGELETQLLGQVRGRGAPAGPAAPAAAAPAAAGTATAAATVAAPAAEAGPGGGNARSLTPQAQAITSTQGIPLFDRKFSLEQGLTYTHYDKRSLVLRGFLALDSILLGRINLQQIKTDQLQYDLTGRWSLTERISVDLNVPLIYRSSQYYSPGAGNSASAVSDEHNSSKALGDASAGIYYQLPKAGPSDLDWIASFRVKSPSGKHPFGIKLRDIGDNDSLLVPTRQATGNGIWSTTLGLSVLKTSDPLVLFFNVAYNYNLPHSFADLSGTLGTVSPGDVKLGNAWSVGAGFALALNDKTSVSFSYAQVVQQAARLRGTGGPWTRQVGSDANSVTFNTGLTHQLTPKWTMVGTVSVGLTPDAPNVSLGIKFPYAF